MVFRNLSLLERVPPQSYVLGFGDASRVQNVLFEGIRHKDRPLTSLKALNVNVQDAQGVRFGE